MPDPTTKLVPGPDGKMYPFPADATPDEIVKFFQDREGPAPVPATRIPLASSMFGSTGMSYDPAKPYENLKTAVRGAPVVAGIMAAPLTAGMSVPASATVSGGLGALSGLADEATSDQPTVAGAAGKATLSGALAAGIDALTHVPGTGKTVTEAVEQIGPKIENIAEKHWADIVKPAEGVAKDVASPEAVAKTTLGSGRGWVQIPGTNAAGIRAGLSDTDQVLADALASGQKTIPLETLHPGMGLTGEISTLDAVKQYAQNPADIAASATAATAKPGNLKTAGRAVGWTALTGHPLAAIAAYLKSPAGQTLAAQGLHTAAPALAAMTPFVNPSGALLRAYVLNALQGGQAGNQDDGSKD